MEFKFWQGDFVTTSADINSSFFRGWGGGWGATGALSYKNDPGARRLA